jgi:integrase
MGKSTKSRPSDKAAALPEQFPLFQHRNGQWAKKRLGKLFYFGKVANGWKDAYSLYEREWPYIHEHGAKPPGVATPAPTPDAATVKLVCNEFLNAKRELVESGEISARTVLDYKYTCERLIEAFGKTRPVEDLRPVDFQQLRTKLAKDRNPVSLGNEIQRIRVVFKFAFDQELIDKPVRYGQTFKKPSRKTLRLSCNEKRRANGKRMFSAEALRAILKHASQPLKTMILLAANCGFGQSDLASLRISDIDLRSGWVDYPRPKTGIERRVPLWPETIKAVREWLPENPKAKAAEDAGLLFITKYGRRWVVVYKMEQEIAEDGTEKLKGGTPDDAIGKEFAKLLTTLKLKRPGLGFYAIRHTFETIGGAVCDQVALDAIMGHVDDSMAAAYREEVSDDRLRKVVDHVRTWLFGSA